jgi:hypothetical protein
MPLISTTLTACAALILLAGVAAAAECKDLHDIIKDETAGPDKYVDTFSFRRDHRADNVLMLVKESVEKGKLPKRWLFLHRDDPKSTALCIVSRGADFGQFDDMPENDSADNFGAPGSGYPSCAEDGKDLKAPELLRNWANRELGSSVILHASDKDGPGYQFLISTTQDWIIIKDEKNQSCLLDRGADLSLRFNILLQN